MKSQNTMRVLLSSIITSSWWAWSLWAHQEVLGDKTGSICVPIAFSSIALIGWAIYEDFTENM